MTLNKADVLALTEVLNQFKVDNFKLIKHDESGIGYCLDIEYQTNVNDRMVTIRVPVVGVENW